MLYRYVGGGRTYIGDQEFSAVGQQAEFATEAEFVEALKGGAAFIPEEVWESLDIDSKDVAILARNPAAKLSSDAAAKLELGRDHFRDLYRLALASLPV